MEFKDYYQILGVAPDADEKTIKSAYRRLARQYHPDVNPGNAEAEEKFKEINEAYQALSNAEQRQKYDALRQQYQQWQRSGGRPQDFGWQEWRAQPGQGPRVQYATEEDLEDLFGGESPFSVFFSQIFGQGRPRTQSNDRTPQPRPGRSAEHQIDISLEEAFSGASRILQIGDRRIEARIPPGVRTGSRVRLSGQGEPGLRGGSSGDLFLLINILPHPLFERDGDDLYVDVPVDIFSAITGGEAHVPTLQRPVVLTIPQQTQADKSLRLRGKGMPHLGDPDTRGDLFARVKLVLPPAMSEQEIQAIRELAEMRQKTA